MFRRVSNNMKEDSKSSNKRPRRLKFSDFLGGGSGLLEGAVEKRRCFKGSGKANMNDKQSCGDSY